MTHLPSAQSKYDASNEAETRQIVAQELDRISEEVILARRTIPLVNAIVASGPVTVPAPRDPSGGYFFALDVKNTTGGAIVVTLDPAFLGAFVSPGAGKRRTQLYWYDRGLAKWVPLGAQSPDL